MERNLVAENIYGTDYTSRLFEGTLPADGYQKLSDAWFAKVDKAAGRVDFLVHLTDEFECPDGVTFEHSFPLEHFKKELIEGLPIIQEDEVSPINSGRRDMNLGENIQSLLNAYEANSCVKNLHHADDYDVFIYHQFVPDVTDGTPNAVMYSIVSEKHLETLTIIPYAVCQKLYELL